MVIHKIKAFSNTSKPTDKDCRNSNPNEEEESDSLNYEREQDYPLSQGKTLEQRKFEEDLPKVLADEQA